MSGEQISEWSDRELAEEVDENGVGLTAWEIQFVDDVLLRLAVPERRLLHAGARAKLEQIARDRLPS